ncbi:general odorant-binding protein 99a-like [Culicoides brevitarsis]|uniref:general odorant-binding protein 99a-like n=1 Tax=Culicoides brevitarsis TaxID=469753 RepID=UPI00307CA859
MKVLCLIFFSVLVLGKANFVAKTAEDVLKFDDECATELGEPADRLTEFKKGEFKEDRLSFCHVHCVAKKMGLFDDEKGTDAANMVKQLKSNNDESEENMLKVVEDCIKSTDDKKEDKCVWAFTGFVCLGEQGLKASPV